MLAQKYLAKVYLFLINLSSVWKAVGTLDVLAAANVQQGREEWHPAESGEKEGDGVITVTAKASYVVFTHFQMLWNSDNLLQVWEIITRLLFNWLKTKKKKQN